MKVRIKLEDIQDELLVCPYCMNPALNKLSCCGEASTHFEKALDTEVYGLILASETRIVESYD